MQEHQLTVGRTARYYTLGKMDRPVKQVWFVCHGYGQLAGRFLRSFDVIDDGTRLIVAPEGLSRFYLGGSTGEHGPDAKVGASWMTREDRLSEIEDYVRYLDALYAEVFGRVDRSAVKLIALGFSQGAATVSRWISRGGARADRLVLWGELVPPDLDLEAAKQTLRALELSLVYGREDRFVTAEKIAEAEARLWSHGITYRLLTYDGGHELHDGVLQELAGM